ncbi:MAG TPA: hypothetical protein EYP14_11700 [Planctomycetaceae bacterium]|nr:hypothetical protein [Planctomycetaceae bacterium]
MTQRILARNASFRIEDITGASIGVTAIGSDTTLSYNADLVDAPGYGDTVRLTVPVITDFEVSFSGYYSTESGNPASALHELVGASAGTWFQFNPAGSAAASPAWSACAHIANLEIRAPADNIVTISFTLKPRSGSLTFAADGSW